MADNFLKIINYWDTHYSKSIQKSNKFDVPEHFKRMADLLSPGKSYYYIVNFHTLELELISESVEAFTGQQPDKVTMGKLLSLAHPDEIDKIHRKEQVIQSFFMDYLQDHERLDYKIMYTYKNKQPGGTTKTMLQQATILSLSDDGRPLHVFGIHIDITHLNVPSTEIVSFINTKDGPSFYNLSTATGVFDPNELVEMQQLKNIITKRELEIVKLLSIGKCSSEIAEILTISPHTVRTHKKNMLEKIKCNNSTHLVAMCITEGLI